MTVANRIASLDTLRGVAALSVVACHLLITLSTATAGAPAPIGAFLARWAVLTFFALSGFVLSLPYFGKKPPSYRRFVARRFCRIYIPYFAVMSAAAFMFYFLIGGIDRLDTQQTVTGATLAQSIFMTGTMPSISLDPVAWSLIVEVRFALVFPLLVVLVRRDWKLSVFAATLLSIAALALIHFFNLDWYGYASQPVLGTSFGASLLISAYFGTLFVGGIVVAMHREAIAKYARDHLPSLWTITVTALALGTAYDPLMLVGALLIVALVPNTPAVVKAFQWSPIAWAGKVSYSLYLIHVLVLIAMWRVTGSALIAAVGFIPISFVLSELCYRYVEVPSIALGRRLTSRSEPIDAMAASAPLPS